MRLLWATLAVLLAGCAASRPPRDPEFRPHARLIVTAGVHGNEESGTVLLPELREAGYTVYGPCNPWGTARGSRYLEDGRDLNRIFGRNDSAEVRAAKRFLKEHPPVLLLDLHEDGSNDGAHLIQHGPDDPLGARIVEQLRGEFEFASAPTFRGLYTGKDGLIRPPLPVLKTIAQYGIYGLATYAWAAYGCTTIVSECPTSWPREKKMRFHRRVVEIAARLLAEREAGRSE